jgi:plasmid stabilization system protein ParE
MIVLRTEPPAPIRWQCSVCDDEGVISNWADSPFDLRRRRLTLADPAKEIVISKDVAAALRELRLLDTECERLVFRIRAHNDRAVLSATHDDLDELIGFVAAEANHESNRRRQQRLDTAFNALSNAAQATDGW